MGAVDRWLLHSLLDKLLFILVFYWLQTRFLFILWLPQMFFHC